MNAIPPPLPIGRECHDSAFQRLGQAPETIVARYLDLVYASARRRTGDSTRATEITRAVFLVLSRRARKLPKKTVLPCWLFDITAVASRKLRPRPLGRSFWSRFTRKQQSLLPPEAPVWDRIAPELDTALDRLSPKLRNAVLLCAFLDHDLPTAARLLRTRERRLERNLSRGLKKLAARLRKHSGLMDAEDIRACIVNGRTSAVPDRLAAEIIQSMQELGNRRPSYPLARRTLATLAWARWRRRTTIAIPTLIVLLITMAGIAWHIDSRSGHSRLISAFIVWSSRNEARRVPGLAQPARPWVNATVPPPNGATVRRASDIYQTTNIWLAHLSFSADQWKALRPKRVGALPNFLQPDGSVLLHNPEARRNGVAGVLGFDFDWTHADIEFGGVRFTNVAARIKGNGTWLTSLSGDKSPFKVDLNKFVQGQKLAGLDELTFNNLACDHSYISDALGYEFFRDAGVPASRTAYCWMTISVAGKWNNKPLGLYVMVEPVDEDFAAERFRSKKTAIFKPVTYQLFEHFGDEWSSYEAIYDPKTKVSAKQEQRIIEFARLVSFATDEEFAARVGDFLDLDVFARFLAVHVLLSSYDSILSNGQNFHMYLDPRSNKFGFIPWDLDLAWGAFFLLGSTTERERASIWHPWVGKNRFIERVVAVEEFRGIYRAHLEDFLARLFVSERLHQRIDELAAVVRSPIAAESDFRLDKFEQAIGEKPVRRSPKAPPHGADRPAHELKRFIDKRAVSVREQLDGKSKGTILKRGRRD